jgi:hypothetical protein
MAHSNGPPERRGEAGTTLQFPNRPPLLLPKIRSGKVAWGRCQPQEPKSKLRLQLPGASFHEGPAVRIRPEATRY